MKPKLHFVFTLSIAMLLLSIVVRSNEVWAADPPLPVEEYWSKLAEIHDKVMGLEPENMESNQIQLQQLADEWQQITVVILADQSTMAVDHSYLVAQLRATPPDLPRLRAIVATLRATAHNWSATPHTNEDLAALTPILDRAEFQWPVEQPSLFWRLVSRVVRAILNFFARFLPENSVTSVPDGAISLNVELISYLITTLSVIALLIILIYLSRNIMAEFAGQAQLNLDQGNGDELLTADSALERARTLSSSGDYRTAVRYLYLSSLLLLDERGLLRYDRSRTNREYLRNVAHSPQLAGILREVIEIFDRVWYGFQELDETTYSRYEARVAELRKQK